MTTTLRLFKGKTWGTCEIRDEFASLLVGIEQARPDCHRFLFGELETRTDPDDSDNEARVVARWIFTTEFLLQLLDIIPHYLNLCERGNSEGAEEEPAAVEFSDKVIEFKPRTPIVQLKHRK